MGEGIRVLHVDDDTAFSDLTATFLERTDGGFSVETATDVDEGLDSLAADEFDCVVSDYEMPGRNGIDFLEAVREEDSNLPFVLFTGKGSEEVASDAIRAGATDYLRKGSGTERYELLANRIRNAVERFRSRRAEQRLLEIADTTEQVVFVFDRDWSELLFISSAYEEVWGQSIADLRSEPTDFLGGIHPDDRDDVRAAMDRLSDGESTEIEYRVTADAERERWIRIRGEPIRDETGEVVRVAGFGAEITEERRRRRRRERQRDTLVELATDDAVTDGRIETALRRVTETTADVLDVDRVSVWLRDEADPDVLTCVGDYDRATDDHTTGIELSVADHPAYLEALETNRAVAVADARTDPRTAELAAYLDEHDVGAVLDGTLRSDGRVVGTICHEHVGDGREWTDDEVEFVSDVADVVHRALRNHERRERERELRRYERIVQSLADAVYSLGGDGTIEFVNDAYAEMKGADPEELVGTHISEWVDDGVLDETEPMYEQVKRGDRDIGRVEYEFRTAEGESVPAELRFTTLPGPGDDPGRVGVIRDVTERRERERKLHRQNERLTEFASVVSHDLRNPLSVAIGNVEIERENRESDRLDAAARALERMDTLIDDLLELAREGNTVSDPGTVDLREVVDRCWHNVDTRNAELVVEIDRSLRADRSRLQQLLENLFRNAVEHGGSEPTITVGELADARGFYVADDGPGIDDDVRERVFESGYSGAIDGTGFGLTIVEQVASAHDWTVRVTDGCGGGARFEIAEIEFVS
ncbi:PAS domain S-box protein [Halorubrum sp. DTA98]|uniref:PAS domain S-box protein n=1 Tax=Halorubrum sp. DTA98 TaxID=3402163 RepID=UPI003AAA34EC